MPTTKKVQTKCQPLVGILSFWYFVPTPSQLNVCEYKIANHMAKPMLPNWVYSYGKTHWMAKPIGGSMAKPMVLFRAQSYGKTHWMGKAIGDSMVKAMEPRL